MKRLALVLATAALFVMANAAVWAEGGEEAPAKPKKAAKTGRAKKPPVKAVVIDVAEMVTVCTLSDEQQKKVTDINDAATRAVSDWDAANAEKLSAAKAAEKAAKDSKDKAAMQKAADETKALTAPREALIDKAKADAVAALTGEQKPVWLAHVDLQAALKALGGKVMLNDEQTTKAKGIVTEKMKGVDRSDKNAVAAGIKACADAIKADVLNDEQRGKLGGKGAGPKGGKKKGGEAPAE